MFPGREESRAVREAAGDLPLALSQPGQAEEIKHRNTDDLT